MNRPFVITTLLAATLLSAACSTPTGTVIASEQYDGDYAKTPRAIERVEPTWPREALVKAIQGQVSLAGTVQRDGRITDVAVIEAEPEGVFEQSAVEAFSQWRYVEQDEPVRIRQTIEYNIQ